MCHTNKKEEIILEYNTLYRLNLVLDLDETLLHSIVIKNNNELVAYYSIMKNLVVHYVRNDEHMFIFYRPYILDFIRTVADLFDLYIYTNGTHFYVDIIIHFLVDKLGYNPFKKIQCRDKTSKEYSKYLSVLDLSASDTIILDDHHFVWMFDKDNQILIKEFLGPEKNDYLDDDDLLVVLDMLKRINNKYNLIKQKVIENKSLTQLIRYENTKYLAKTYIKDSPSMDDVRDAL